MLEEPEELGELTNDAIAGDFRITQRKHGHRYSLDDVLTAWEAASSAPEACECLELGSGIGSVLLMLAYKLPRARFHAVEAQRNSFRLLSENVRQNALSERVTLVHGDLRAWNEGSFELVTGTPPYVPVGTATPASDSQKAYARQELRGGVEVYLAAIGRVLAPDGVAVVCADARAPERAFEGARRANLVVVRQRDVVPRAGKKGALFSLFTVKRAGQFEHAPPWVARDEAGARTQAYLDVRAFFGLTPRGEELPSP
jgi:tRNA1Val (adenine37-N6)-methyltransferase